MRYNLYMKYKEENTLTNLDVKQNINNTSIIEQIPDKLMKAFTKRAIRDAEKIIDVNDSNFQEISYAIFRGYCVGFSFGKSNKFIE